MTLPSPAPPRISIWDEETLRSALDEAGVKPVHVQSIYRSVEKWLRTQIAKQPPTTTTSNEENEEK